MGGSQIEVQLADFAARAVVDDNARQIMRLCIFDWSVCALAGQAEPVSEILRAKGKREGGKGQATLVGGGVVPAARAALINGATSHALDYDDTHFGHIGHTSVAVVPAALAVAEVEGRTMAEFVDAALIGSEAAVRIGMWLGRDHYQAGFHQTATSGAFGAALASARLMAATHEECLVVIGLAATRASGLKSQFGSMGKPLNAGLAAETGVEAAQWSAAGLTSTESGLSGSQGFGETHHGRADLSAFDGLGTTWQMNAVSFKFHACCHGLHAMLEVLHELDLDVAKVRSLRIETHPRWMSVCNKANPSTGLEAKFSYIQTAAMRLLGVDTSSVRAFGDDVALHPAIAAVRDRISVVANDHLTELQARVSVDLTDGGVMSGFHDLAAPRQTEVLEGMLLHKAARLIGTSESEKLWEAVHGNSLRTYVEVLGGASIFDAFDGLDTALEALEFLGGLGG